MVGRDIVPVITDLSEDLGPFTHLFFFGQIDLQSMTVCHVHHDEIWTLILFEILEHDTDILTHVPTHVVHIVPERVTVLWNRGHLSDLH
jgi:hypothetical protein